MYHPFVIYPIDHSKTYLNYRLAPQIRVPLSSGCFSFNRSLVKNFEDDQDVYSCVSPPRAKSFPGQ